MGKPILYHDGKFLEWSTVVDAPVTYGMSRHDMLSYLDHSYGHADHDSHNERLNRAERHGTSIRYAQYTCEEFVAGNRAGPDESNMPFDELVRHYFEAGDDDTLTRLRDLIEDCKFMHYTLRVRKDSRGAYYLQATYPEECIDSGNVETQYTRRWPLSPEATKSEVVQTAFKCCITSMEHRTREHFLYKGKRVFGPHFDVDALWGICDQLDEREKPHGPA